MESKFKRILYGGDYNPNQWPEEIWEDDMRIFAYCEAKRPDLRSKTVAFRF